MSEGITKPKRARKSVMLRVKLGAIKHIWYDLIGYFLGLRTSKNFPYKVMVVASLLYAIAAYKSFIGTLL